MKRKPTSKQRRIHKLECERDAAKECIVLTACYMFQGLSGANLLLLGKYVDRYQEANRQFEKVMGGHFQ